MKPLPDDCRRLLLVPLAALVAVLPLIFHGASCGHDFDFHLLNWMEAAHQFSHGNLYPHWAFTPAFNAGEPRFVFYPPLSWVLGALLGLLLPHLPHVSEAAGWSAAPILFTWIALTASGLTLYRLARAFAGANAALLAAVLYLANPYMLFTAVERTAYAELLAAAWIPLLFHAILRERVTIPRIALPVALLWLTNAPAAVMGTYTLAFLAAIRVVLQLRDRKISFIPRRHATLELALNTIAGTALGLGLAAFYIIPAAYQRRFVHISMATIAGMRIDRNFLFEHTGTSSDALLHDAVLHTASLIAVTLLAATTVALAAIRLTTKPGAPGLDSETWVSRHNITFPTHPLALLAAGIAFLLTPLSLPLWKHAPQAVFLQFPWRLLAILAPVCVLSLARAFTVNKNPGAPSIAASSRWVGRKKSAATAVAALVLAIALSHSAYHHFSQPCDPDDTAPARLALFHSNLGTDPTDEYTPITADNDALASTGPPYWLADSPDAAPPATANPGPLPSPLTLSAPHSEFLILNLRDYPAWSITRNGAPIPHPAQRDDGLIAIPIPAGASTLDIRYARTPDQTLGDAITLLALALFVFTCRGTAHPS